MPHTYSAPSNSITGVTLIKAMVIVELSGMKPKSADSVTVGRISV